MIKQSSDYKLNAVEYYSIVLQIIKENIWTLDGQLSKEMNRHYFIEH